MMVARQQALFSGTTLREKLEELRTQLIDLAFVLERRGQVEAADVAIATSSRIDELCEELPVEPVRSSGPRKSD
jgi:hypothetical protein